MAALDSTLGCVFIGVVVSVSFYGCTLAQIVYYACHYAQDRRIVKAFVFLLWTLDTVSTTLHITFLWTFVVSWHGNTQKIRTYPGSGIAGFIVVLVITLIVQLYYTRVIWKLISRKLCKLLIGSLLMAMSLISFSFGIGLFYQEIRHPYIPNVLHDVSSEVSGTAQPLIATIADVCITVTLSLLLQSKRKSTIFERTNNLINTLTVWAINRGVLTAALQASDAITYIDVKTSGYYSFIFHVAAGKAYVNSALATLNARDHIRNSGCADDGEELTLNTRAIHLETCGEV